MESVPVILLPPNKVFEQDIIAVFQDCESLMTIQILRGGPLVGVRDQ
jgi:hypothetical protein